MASSYLKKMLFFVNFNTDGVRGLVCPAIFGTLDGLCDKCLNHQAIAMPIYWLMFANVVFCIWKMLLPCFLLQMLLPLLCIFIGRYYCHILLADVIAMICILQSFCQMLLPLWLLLLPLVGMMYYTIAGVMAVFRVM